MQALMLAAGMGRRLGKYTEAQTKCMIEVGGRTLLDRAAESLKLAGVNRLIMVVGWEGDVPELGNLSRIILMSVQIIFILCIWHGTGWPKMIHCYWNPI